MNTPSLFSEYNLDPWEDEWQDMPEFVQQNAQPCQSVLVHFGTVEERNDFAKLLNQTITDKTKYIWYPKYDAEKPSNFLYVTENL